MLYSRHICGVMVSKLDYKIGIYCLYCFSTSKHADWFVRNRDNVSECGDKSIRGLLFQ